MKNPQLEKQLDLVATSLQQRFNGISQKELGAAFADTEYKRANWLVAAVMFGMKCLAAKPHIEHGKFLDYIAKSIKDKDGKSLESARRYMRFAQKIINQIAWPDSTNEIGARVVEYFDSFKGKKPKFDTLLATEESIAEILRFLLEGLSLRGLAKALQGVDMQVAIEEKCANTPPMEIPEDKVGIVQLSFEEELFAPIGEIQKLIKTDSFAGLPKDKALQFAEALIAEGQSLKQKIVKEK